MNNVKVNFSIKDLENLSGIKAHTIRIWEKRYNLLSPNRTDTNIRYYSLKSLQKLLNITLLYNNGYKISRIAKIPEDELPIVVREIVSENSVKNKAINAFKLAMINFDQSLFLNTYNSLLGDRSFREIFYEIFLPLLNELGLLWQTDTISPAHEHFVTALIKQKILLNIEKLQLAEPTKTDHTFVLYLPDNEIHEIGLLYLNYEIVLRGYRVIYLGQTIPVTSLPDIQRYYDNIIYLSYFTVAPPAEEVESYLDEFQTKVNKNGDCKLWILGQQVKGLVSTYNYKDVSTFHSIEEVTESL
ncbi:MerR family transcriptional regulator [Robertkochia marina]|uniref:MerR family transcriptional regulator n=1 Tax=Robertkochia marina TaxID=1227945 RepID=A0A4S3LYJ1_9FLAO|nr:MerR family transcriptional regulator [Robertkochia marina]THD65857.1 MerR family transcriptional regulator [Robertkochia marina]TRZ41360.1 MerR family transcriptional regulator [Robertkochia marina]